MADDLAGRAAHWDRCRDRHCPFVELGRAVIGQMFLASEPTYKATMMRGAQFDKRTPPQSCYLAPV
jgi:hypothetical protein